MRSVTLKSAMTPSFNGRIATMWPGVRPSISLASLPTATTSPLVLLMATMEGSFTTIPFPLAKTSVLAVPRSIARSEESRMPSQAAGFQWKHRIGDRDAEGSRPDSRARNVGAIFVPGATTRDSGHLLFLREGTLLAQTFDIQKLELTGEPTPVAEHVGTYSSLGQFSAASNSVLIYRVGGSAEERLTWYDRQGNV